MTTFVIDKYKRNEETSQDLSADRLRFHPEMLLHAIKLLHGGGVRLWLIARFLDAAGSSAIPQVILSRCVVKELKVPRRTYENWLIDAQKLGVLKQRIARDGNKILDIKGAAAACVLLGIERVRRVELIPIKTLVEKHWQAHTWSAFLHSISGKDDSCMLSRKTLQAMTGIGTKTQYEYERIAGVEAKKQYAVHRDLYQDQHAKLSDQEGVFQAGHKTGGKLSFLKRLPDRRKASGKTGNIGRSKKINKKLKKTCIKEDQESTQFIRLFCDNNKQIKLSMNKIKRRSIAGYAIPGTLYAPYKTAGNWMPISV